MAALGGVDLDLASGDVVALVGANGSGKTTLLRVVAGLARPASGSALVLGESAGSRRARSAVAFVPDEPGGLDELTVDEHVALLRALARTTAEPGEAALAMLGLDPWRHVRVGALSRGLRRRAALAAALAPDPEVLVIDEATVALDGPAVDALVAILRSRAAAGKVSLLASHDLGFVERACGRAVVLRDGMVVGVGPAAVAGVLAALPTSPITIATRGGAVDAAAHARSLA